MADANVENTNKSEGKVIVTLCSGDRNSCILERRLTLTRDLPTIRIGRASKTPTKGFVAAKDNAWFDSPVMSRQHAELFADFNTDPKIVFIKDVGSLHGTFLTPNDGRREESKMPPDVKFKLSNGDVLRFGADVMRTDTSFPPCNVDFFMEDQSRRPVEVANRVFAVPSDVDDGEEEEEESCDRRSAVEKDAGYPVTPVPPPASYRRPSIDLTQQYLPPYELPAISSSATIRPQFSSDVIDLTSDIEQESYMDSEVESPVSSPVIAAKPNSQHLGADIVGCSLERVPSPIPVIPSAQYSVDQSFADGDNEIVSSDSELECERDWELGSQPDSDLGSQMTGDDSEHLSEVGDLSEDNSSESSDDALDYLKGDFNRELVREDVESDCSDCSADDMDDDDYCNDRSIASSSPPSILQDSDNDSDNNAPIQTFSHGSIEFACPQACGPNDRFTPSVDASLNPPTSQARLPSPSDAAMFKSQPVRHRSSSSGRAQALGEKTGKMEYFAAREDNRAAISKVNVPVLVSDIGETLVPTAGNNSDDNTSVAKPTQPEAKSSGAITVPEEVAELDDEMTTDTQRECSIALEDPEAPQDSALATSAEKFLNNPSKDDLPQLSGSKQQTPDFDMSSAYAYQESKLAANVNVARDVRRLPIQDLLSQEPKYRRPFHNAILTGFSTVNSTAPSVSSVPKLGLGSVREVAPGPVKRSFEEAFTEGQVDDTQRTVDDITFDRADAVLFNVNEENMLSPSDVDHNDVEPSQPSADVLGNYAPIKPAKDVYIFKAAREPVVMPEQQESCRPVKKRRFGFVRTAGGAAACAAIGSVATFFTLVNTAPVL